VLHSTSGPLLTVDRHSVHLSQRALTRSIQGHRKMARRCRERAHLFQPPRPPTISLPWHSNLSRKKGRETALAEAVRAVRKNAEDFGRQPNYAATLLPATPGPSGADGALQALRRGLSLPEDPLTRSQCNGTSDSTHFAGENRA
jgi:hypothetical protein